MKRTAADFPDIVDAMSDPRLFGPMFAGPSWGNWIDIVVATADFKLVRGRTVLLCVMNETCFWPSENAASPDLETYRAVLPSMATLGNKAMVIMISSAYKRDGLLYGRWKRFHG